MIASNVVLVLSGIICLALSALMLYGLKPREGKPPSRWMKSDFGASTAVFGWMILTIAGVMLLAKGLF